MIHLAYTSTAVDPIDADGLAQILEEAHDRNRALEMLSHFRGE